MNAILNENPEEAARLIREGADVNAKTAGQLSLLYVDLNLLIFTIREKLQCFNYC